VEEDGMSEHHVARKKGINFRCREWVKHPTDYLKKSRLEEAVKKAVLVARTEEEREESRHFSKLRRIARLENEACCEEEWG
jgi:hypothetical protein